jgi:hypothetical protein
VIGTPLATFGNPLGGSRGLLWGPIGAWGTTFRRPGTLEKAPGAASGTLGRTPGPPWAGHLVFGNVCLPQTAIRLHICSRTGKPQIPRNFVGKCLIAKKCNPTAYMQSNWKTPFSPRTFSPRKSGLFIAHMQSNSMPCVHEKC